MESVLLLVVVISSIWVYVDAKNIGVQKGQIPGMADMGPISWLVSSLLLWIIVFPLYLVKRSKFKEFNMNKNFNSANNVISQIEKLAEMKANGILTEDEFNKKKSELLN